MNVSIQIDLRKLGMRQLAEMVTGSAARTRLSQAMGLGVREVTRDHLRLLAGTRHATAERLGASPSGHLAQAARAVEAAPIAADAEGATLTIDHPGLGRAFHDVTIVPRTAKALTIPIAAIAYNRRAGQFSDLFVLRRGDQGFLAQRDASGGAPILLFLLVRSVTQPQDRTLLPSTEEWEAAAAQAARDWRDSEIAALTGATT